MPANARDHHVQRSFEHHGRFLEPKRYKEEPECSDVRRESRLITVLFRHQNLQ